MNRIVSAIKSGFQDKAIKVLEKADNGLSFKQALALFNLSIENDLAQIYSWFRSISIHRFELNKISLDYQLSRVCSFGSAEIMKTMISIENNFFPIIRGVGGKYFEILKVDLRLIKILLSSKDFNIDGISDKLFLRACRENSISIIKTLLDDRRVNITWHIYSCFNEAAESGQIDIIKLLLMNERLNPCYNSNRLFLNACSNGQLEIVKLLLSDGRINPSECFTNPLFCVCKSNYADILELLLLDGRADPSVENNYILKQACLGADKRIVWQLLLDKRVDPSRYCVNLFDYACCGKFIDLFEFLLNDPRLDPTSGDNATFGSAIHHGGLHLSNYYVMIKELILER